MSPDDDEEGRQIALRRSPYLPSIGVDSSTKISDLNMRLMDNKFDHQIASLTILGCHDDCNAERQMLIALWLIPTGPMIQGYQNTTLHSSSTSENHHRFPLRKHRLCHQNIQLSELLVPFLHVNERIPVKNLPTVTIFKLFSLAHLINLGTKSLTVLA